MNKPVRKTVALDLESFEKLQDLCAEAKRNKGGQLAVLISEAHKSMMVRRNASSESY